jgi:hypothetical protein
MAHLAFIAVQGDGEQIAAFYDHALRSADASRKVRISASCGSLFCATIFPTGTADLHKQLDRTFFSWPRFWHCDRD